MDVHPVFMMTVDKVVVKFMSGGSIHRGWDEKDFLG
jgi:hypothetical protein